VSKSISTTFRSLASITVGKEVDHDPPARRKLMANWQEFADEQPDLAAYGARLLTQFGVGLGFIATVRRDGGPRLHPCCPAIANGRLWVFIGGQSPKAHDLLRDGRYALHSFPPAEGDEEFYLSGNARRVDDPGVRFSVAQVARIGSHKKGDHYEASSREILFELDLDACLHTTWQMSGKPGTSAHHTIWRPGRGKTRKIDRF
jgi:Pyridoxamine 5'-phosphate oxidase